MGEPGICTGLICGAGITGLSLTLVLIYFQVMEFKTMLKCRSSTRDDQGVIKSDCISLFLIACTVLEVIALIVICLMALFKFTCKGNTVEVKRRRSSQGKKRAVYRTGDIPLITRTKLKFVDEPKSPKKINNTMKTYLSTKYLEVLERRTHRDLYDYVSMLVTESWRDRTTSAGKDAKGLSHQELSITKICRIRNDELWRKYESAHAQTLPRYSIPHDLETRPIITTSVDTPPMKCGVANSLIKPLDKGEVHLFHGTQLENINDILSLGFNIHKSARGLYGHPGIYLAESSQKADQYGDDIRGRRWDNLSMFLVRTSLGDTRIFQYNENTLDQCDTVVGGRFKRFREFVKKDASQTYPEFLIIYERR